MQPDPKTGNPRIWTRQDGTPSASYEVNALTVKFLSTRTEGGAHAEAPAPAEGGETLGTDEEGIPF